MAIVQKFKEGKPRSYKKGTDVAQVLSDICDDMKYQFENNGFSKVASNLSLSGTYLDQIQKLSGSYEFDYYIDNCLLAVTPKDGYREVPMPIISPKTGLIGYPIPDMRGVYFKCFYDPLIKFGGLCKIQDSVIGISNGEWRIYGLQKRLESNQAGGDWYCEVAATWRDSKDVAIA